MKFSIIGVEGPGAPKEPWSWKATLELQRFWHRINTAAAALALTAFLYLLVLFYVLARNDLDPSVFVVAGDSFFDPQSAPPNLRVYPNSVGYDGQYYYRLALNPLTEVQEEGGIHLGNPPYFSQRILYPALAWALSLGRAALVPAALIGINYAALCLLGWLGGRVAQAAGLHALWGLAFSLYPGFLLSFLRDLTEVLENGLLLGSLVALEKRPVLATALLTLAVLARETAVIVAVAALSLALLARDESDKRLKWHYGAVPLAVLGLWQIVVQLRWGMLPVLAGGNNLGLPLAGLLPFAERALQEAGAGRPTWLVELLLILGFAVAALRSLSAAAAPRHEKLAWALYGALALCLNSNIWVEDWSFLRALSEFHLLGWLILFRTLSRLRGWLVAPSFLLWLLLAFARPQTL